MFLSLGLFAKMARVTMLSCLGISKKLMFYVLKSPFLRSYVETIMEGLNIDSTYCETYFDVNIRDREFGNDDKWKRSKTGKTRGSGPRNGNFLNGPKIVSE